MTDIQIPEEQIKELQEENHRLKVFIYSIFVQCLNEFNDPYREDESHKETMKHCYEQIKYFADNVPNWGTWNYKSEAWKDGYQAGKEDSEE